MKTQNTFADGINMDVNPLVAPKTTMSNCLNGTLITFNGNENVLQNDMGNIKIDLAYLPSGWVPVGMAEHGGIIYVAAYNPETGKSLLGSFPSPLLNFENTKEDKSTFSLTPGKYKLFKDKELELKPGNKLSILLDSNLYPNTEPNFTIDSTKHKKHWNIQLELLTSNGALTNITEYLNNAVETTANKDYFFVSTDYTTMSETELHSLLKLNLRVYSGTLVGVPYVTVSENLAESLEVEVYPGIEEGDIKSPIFKANCIIRSSSQLYEYDNKGLIGIEWKVSAKDLNNEDYLSNGKIYFDASLSNVNGTSEILNIDFVDADKRDYVVNLQAIFKPNIAISLLSTSSDKLTLEIHPIFRWQDSEDKVLEDLFYRQTFEALKIGTGLHLINQWRYYYTEDFVTLIWGMESYPSMDENIYNLQISFIDLNLETVYTQSLPHEYYNGEFTELFSSSIFSSKTPYIAKISWKVGQKELADYRWIIPTPLYNDFYQNKLVLDFNFAEPNTVEELEMQSLKTIEGNILKFANNPTETITHVGEEAVIPFFTLNPDIDTVNITNTYKYTLNPKVVSTDTLSNYPFLVAYNLPSKITYIKDGILYNNFIENTLTTEHRVQYDYKTNISVSKLFANHTEDLLKTSKCYLVIEVRRRNQSDFHKDDNELGYFAYDTTTGTKCIEYLELDSRNTDGTVEFELNWDTISSKLDWLRNRYALFIIPVIFTNRKMIGLNYAVKKEENWCLYWSTEQKNTYLNLLIGGGIRLRDEYYTLESMFASNKNNEIGSVIIAPKFNVPATVYEARTEYWNTVTTHQLGFPFYRNVSTNGANLTGYLVNNVNDLLIEEEELEFKFSVLSDNINLTLSLNSKPYNEVIQDWLDLYFNSLYNLYSNSLKIKKDYDVISKALTFQGSTTTISKEYNYVNVKPGNFEVWQTINNYVMNGLPAVIRKPYLVGNTLEYLYILPSKELEGDTVYKLEENGELEEFNDASVQKYNDEYYIVRTLLAYHNPDEIEAVVNSDRCYISLGNLFSFRGDELFGTSKRT